MKDCRNCLHGTITEALKGRALEHKVPLAQTTSRYCLLTRNHTNFTRPKTKDEMYFECGEFELRV